MIIYSKTRQLFFFFASFVDRQTFLGFDMTSNPRDHTSPLNLLSSRFLNKELLCRIHGSIVSMASSSLCSGGLQRSSSERSKVPEFKDVSGIDVK